MSHLKFLSVGFDDGSKILFLPEDEKICKG